MKKITFITKNYPPAIGGMEQYCADLHIFLEKEGYDVTLIANRNGHKGLPLFGIRALFLGIRYGCKSDCIWIGDGSISWLGWIVGFFVRKPVYITIHALDITRNKRLYQKIIPWFVKQSHRVVCVSSYTKQECIQRGLDPNKLLVIPNAKNSDELPNLTGLKSFDFEANGIEHAGKKILFSIGRHIERKGIHWFLKEVMPRLGNDYIYIIGGKGKWTAQYEKIIKENGLKNVFLLGRISDEDKFALYNESDLFIMPNIPVLGDAEGFGIVCIEASWYGLPVIASAIEGITDAVIDGKTGLLLGSGEIDARVNGIKKIKLEKSKVQKTTRETFDRSSIIKHYVTLIEKS